MSTLAKVAVWLVGLTACSGTNSESDPAQTAQSSSPRPAAAAERSGVEDPGRTQTEVLPLGGLTPRMPQLPNPAFATFIDPDTGFRTQEVRDVDRQIVHFDAESDAMVWGASGDAVRGWVTEGNDLRWERGGAFRVRFGSEAGEQRAYFTEADRGTLCNLEISGPEQLSIRPSNEPPPRL